MFVASKRFHPSLMFLTKVRAKSGKEFDTPLVSLARKYCPLMTNALAYYSKVINLLQKRFITVIQGQLIFKNVMVAIDITEW